MYFYIVSRRCIPNAYGYHRYGRRRLLYQLGKLYLSKSKSDLVQRCKFYQQQSAYTLLLQIYHILLLPVSTIYGIVKCKFSLKVLYPTADMCYFFIFIRRRNECKKVILTPISNHTLHTATCTI